MQTWKQKWKGFKQTVSDGCTMSPDMNFRVCCEEHDFYYKKREKDTGISRRVADKRLRLCIKERWKFKTTIFGKTFTLRPILLPWIYWCGVRCIGWRFWMK